MPKREKKSFGTPIIHSSDLSPSKYQTNDDVDINVRLLDGVCIKRTNEILMV